MNRTKIIALVGFGIVAAVAAERYLGSSRYYINGVSYAVPHKYEFMRHFSLPWLRGARGLDKEPDEAVWLLIPADQLERGVRGYKRLLHGYSSEFEADVVVNVLGGNEAREFPRDRDEEISKVRQEIAQGGRQQLDKATGWNRVYWLEGQKGTPGEGGALFYLIPTGGLQSLPQTWRPPSCQSSPDINHHETYDCSFVIYRNGLTFDFSLRQENVGTADHIPEYVLSRMNEWRV